MADVQARHAAPPQSIFEPDTLARIEAYQGYRSAIPYAHVI